ncbi:MAG: hypothetical protein NZ823_18500 [Blastocatellia bacterium]|nr:hypothetical protein [Blastocatellia bacterium]
MAVADDAGLAGAVNMASARPHEVTLVEATLDQRVVSQEPERLVGDRVYDNNRLRQKMADGAFK